MDQNGEKKTDGVGLFKAKLKDLKSFLKLKWRGLTPKVDTTVCKRPGEI